MMTNKPGGMIYAGVTSDLAARVFQHKQGQGSAFCRRYNLTRLVYAEEHATIEEAIAREKTLKARERSWKVRLVQEANPDWDDLLDKGGALTS